MKVENGDFIQTLPKAELHLHLEGALPWDMVQARVRSLSSPPPWWAPGYRFESFHHFAETIRLCYASTLASAEDYYLAAQRVFAGLLAQNVRYVEMSFSLGHVLSRGLPLPEIADAIRRAAPVEMSVRVFCGFSRSRPHLLRDDVVEAVLHLPGIDGVDLHGDETGQAPARFAALFAQARQQGLATKAHAGELAGPQIMEDTIDTLGLSRVEHGVRAIEDEGLLSRLIAEGITLDMCPTSNAKLGVVRDIAAHPIHQFHQRGIRVTVSTDNPTILGCNLTDELHLLVECLGFSQHDLAQLQVNAFRVALMPATRRAEILAEIERVLARPASDASYG